ncbi:MAG TPA: hypothetical protein EYN96_00575 [Candidatus Hydrogenedentes bacterium]|nr:hypothetical protein [Candidatus Hydrogenedentota bacterium]
MNEVSGPNKLETGFNKFVAGLSPPCKNMAPTITAVAIPTSSAALGFGLLLPPGSGIGGGTLPCGGGAEGGGVLTGFGESTAAFFVSCFQHYHVLLCACKVDF